MITLKEPAFAKINLTLDVLSKRADGYHDIQSIMQSVSLCDEITIILQTGKGWSLECSKPDIPCDSRNLAWKAAVVFFEATGVDPEGISVYIDKKIPSQAGLGGGSSDAAAVLLCLNRHYKNRLSQEALLELGAKVGSDVPFCIQQGAAMAEGRGEKLRKLSKMPGDCWIVICKPSFSASTPVLYRMLDESVIRERPRQTDMERALQEGNLLKIAEHICNVFEPVMASIYPEVYDIKALYHKNGALGVQMTGSGSAIFGIFDSRTKAESLITELNSNGYLTFLSKPV